MKMKNIKKLYELIELNRGGGQGEIQVTPFILGSLFKKLERLSGKDYLARLVRAEEDIESEFNKIIAEIEQLYPELDGIHHIDITSLEKTRRFWLEFDRYLDEVTDLSKWVDELIDELSGMGGRASDLFPTPQSVNELAIQLLDPSDGHFHDSMSGLGGSLLTVQRYVEKKNKKLHLSGQDISSVNVAVAKVRLFIEGVDDAVMASGDIISSPQFVEGGRLQKFDYVFIDPPFGLSWRPETDKFDRFIFGTPPSSKMELAVLTHALVSLKEKGRAVVLTTAGALYTGGSSAKIRQNIIDLDYIEAVIALPSSLYHYTALQTNLIVMNKDKKSNRRGEILFINGEEEYQEIGKRKRAISEEGIQKIVDTFSAWESIVGFSKVVRNEDLNEGNLMPSQYIFSPSLTIEPFGELEVSMDKVEELDTTSLSELVKLFRGYNVSPSDEDTEGRYKIVKASDVQDGQLHYENITRYTIQKNFNKEDYRLRKGDILITVRGKAIKVAYVEVEDDYLLFSQNFLAIRCGKKVDPQFLKLYLQGPVAQFILTSKLSGTTIPVLNRKDLEQLPFPNIPMEEQQIIARRTVERDNTLRLELERIQNEMKDNRHQSYKDMGIANVYTIKN